MREYRIRRKISTMFCLLLLVACFINADVVHAASASISIETKDAVVQVGDTVTVNLVLQGTARLGGFEAFLTYNSSALEFQSSDGPIAGGEGILRISDIEPLERTKKRTYEITFVAMAVGGCEIAISDNAHVYEDDGGNEMSVSSNSLSIKVEASEEASDNTRLGTLKVNPSGLEPEFSAEVLEYDLQVGPEISSLVISAVPEDAAATVTVAGNQDFSEGENLVEITVKAENADSQIYRIRVCKSGTGEQEVADKEEVQQDDTEEFSLKSLGDGFLFSGQYSYFVTEAPVSAWKELPEEYEAYTLVLYGEKIPAYRQRTEQAENDHAENDEPATVMLYVEGTPEETGFYEFDRETRTMTRVKIVVQEKVIEVTGETDTDNEWTLYIIIVMLAVVCAFLGMGLIRAGQSGRKRKRR